MTLQDKLDDYKTGSKTHIVELITRNQKACAFIINKINETSGGWGVLKDIPDPHVEAAKNVIVTVMGEVNFKHLVMTQSIMKSVLS